MHITFHTKHVSVFLKTILTCKQCTQIYYLSYDNCSLRVSIHILVIRNTITYVYK